MGGLYPQAHDSNGSANAADHVIGFIDDDGDRAGAAPQAFGDHRRCDQAPSAANVKIADLNDAPIDGNDRAFDRGFVRPRWGDDEAGERRDGTIEDEAVDDRFCGFECVECVHERSLS
jgi:hypothetical protein